MRQFLLDVLAMIVAGIVVALISRHFDRSMSLPGGNGNSRRAKNWIKSKSEIRGLAHSGVRVL